jgi:hypothetical protein
MASEKPPEAIRSQIKAHYNHRVTRAAFITAIVSLSMMVGGIIVWDAPDMVSTSYYHANIQYRVGNEHSYRDIIEQTFQHVIWMHGNHTNWHYTIECQLLLLEYVNVNYPTLFAAIKDHNNRGQLELIVPQYSDSFMVPFPGKDMWESMKYTQTRMNELGLIQSKLILLQEGQWLPGFPYLANAMNMNGFIVSKEMLAYFNIYPTQPVIEWTFGGQSSHVVVTPWVGTMEAGVYHHVIYIQDSEKINTGGNEMVGVAEFFNYNPEKQANYEARHIELEKKGNKFLTMSEFYDHCVNKNYVGKLDKYMPETEWVAAQYETFFTWMGKGAGAADDGYMLARDYYARNLIQTTDLLLQEAISKGIVNKNTSLHGSGLLDPIGAIIKPRATENYTIEEWLLEAKKCVWEAMVTDATGITPAWFEFQYGLNKTRDAIQICDFLIEYIKNQPGTFNVSLMQILPFNQTIFTNPNQFLRINSMGTTNKSTIEAEFGLTIKVEHKFEPNISHIITTESKELVWKNVKYNLTQLDFYFPGRYNITLNHRGDMLINETEFNKNNLTLPGGMKNEISVIFADDFSKIAYSPSINENFTVTLNRSDYYQHPFNSENEWFVRLAACNGLYYNTNKGYAIIKTNTIRHLAGTWRPDSIEFLETDVKYNSHHQYILVKGELAEVLDLANLLNSYAPMEV